MTEINTDRMVQSFCEMVKIPSEAPDDQKFISYMENIWKNMGAKTQKDAYGNLVAAFSAKNSQKTEPVAFATHADTVKPGIGIEPIIKDGIISSNGSTILGGDDKAAIAEITETLLCAEKHPPVELILTRCEEIGTLGSSNFDYSMIKSKTAYAVDTCSIEEVVVGGPTLITIDVEYKGIPAHAGMAPEKGISAILAASKAISRLRLGKLDEESTANVGVFNGGQIRNGIPDKATLLAECRSLNHQKAETICEEMKKIFKEASDEVGTEVKLESKVSLKAYLLDEKQEFVQNYLKALKKHGVNPDIKTIRGGSDATLFNQNGLKTLVVGAAYREPHSCKETVIVSEMTTICNVMKTLLEDLA
jgi:tripeptide aminopeptidase